MEQPEFSRYSQNLINTQKQLLQLHPEKYLSSRLEQLFDKNRERQRQLN